MVLFQATGAFTGPLLTSLRSPQWVLLRLMFHLPWPVIAGAVYRSAPAVLPYVLPLHQCFCCPFLCYRL